MKALIVGAAGFVGHHLFRHLAEDLHWDVAVTKLPSERFDGGTEAFDLDILDQDAILALLLKIKPQAIFHLAAQSSVALSWDRIDLTVDVNVKGSLHLLQALKEQGERVRAVLIGSGEEYGYVRQDEVPVVEDNPLRPGNLYAMTKAAQTMAGQIYARAYGVDVLMVRAFNHIGPGQAQQFVLSDFCKQVAEMEAGIRPPVMHVGNLSAKRDFTDVRDVVRAYAMLAEKGKTGTVYNVGSGRAYSIRQLLDTVLSMSKLPVRVEVDKGKIRPSDVPVLMADIQRLQGDTGWEPIVPLEKSVSDTLDYWRSRTRQE